MFLSIATTHQPATDLGYLLHKHPERLHQIELTFGKAWVFYPEAGPTRRETALVLDSRSYRFGPRQGAGRGLARPIRERPALCGVILSIGRSEQGVSDGNDWRL